MPKNSPAEVSCEAGTFAIPKSMSLGSPGGEDHHVGRLHVPVDDPPRVGVVQGLGQPRGQPKGLPPVGSLPAHPLVEGLALQVLEGDEQGVRVGVPPDVVDHHDPGMAEPGRHPGLRLEAALEALALVGGDRPAQADRLEGDRPPQRRVEGAVHDAHHPAPDLLLDLVPAEEAGADSARQVPPTGIARRPYSTRAPAAARDESFARMNEMIPGSSERKMTTATTRWMCLSMSGHGAAQEVADEGHAAPPSRCRR